MTDKKNWSSAKTACESKNAHLVTILSEAQQKEITSLIEEDIWIGLHYNDGEFRWRSGASIEYSNWGKNEPNNENGNEECVELLHSTEWNDNKCENERSFICETAALSGNNV